MTRVRSAPVRWLLVAAGTLFVGLGVVGAFLPVLPTTPFLLLAAACYVRSSERLYIWLHENRFFGDYLRRYRDGEGIPLGTKVSAILLLWVALGYSVLVAVPPRLVWVRCLLPVIGLCVTAHLVSLPTFPGRSTRP